MPFDFNSYSVFLLVFFIHGLVYSFLLYKRGILNNTASDKWLGFYLLLCILYIAPWMLGFAGWYDGYKNLLYRNLLFYIPFQQTLLIGPVIFFYIKSLLHPSFKLSKKMLWHFVPALIYNCWIIVVAVTDNIILKKYFLMNGQQDPDFDNWYILLGIMSMLVYLWYCYSTYKKYRKNIEYELSFADEVAFKWIKNFLIVFIIYLAYSLCNQLYMMVSNYNGYTIQWWYYLTFALLFYYIAIEGYNNSHFLRYNFKISSVKNSLEKLPTADFSQNDTLSSDVENQDNTTEKITLEASINEEQNAIWKLKIIKAMQEDHQYKNPQLTLTDLANYLQTSPPILSRIINQSFEMNFNDFINFYRVEEVKEKLKNNATEQFTIMSIAYDAGFNSKSTFNRAFKKFTSTNPSDY